MVAHLAIRSGATGARTRVHTVSITARHVTTTIGMVEALGTATVRDGIAAVSGWTRADRAPAQRLLAQCVCAAWIARASLAYKGDVQRKSCLKQIII